MYLGEHSDVPGGNIPMYPGEYSDVPSPSKKQAIPRLSGLAFFLELLVL